MTFTISQMFVNIIIFLLMGLTAGLGIGFQLGLLFKEKEESEELKRSMKK